LILWGCDAPGVDAAARDYSEIALPGEPPRVGRAAVAVARAIAWMSRQVVTLRTDLCAARRQALRVS